MDPLQLWGSCRCQGARCLRVVTCVACCNDERVGRAREHLCGCSGSCPDDIVLRTRGPRSIATPSSVLGAVLRLAHNRSRSEPRRRALSAHDLLLAARVFSSSRSEPPMRTTTGSSSTMKTSDLTICATSQPIAGAASLRGSRPSGNARTSTFSPRLAAAATRRSELPMRDLRHGGRLRIATTTPRQAQSTHGPATYIPGAKSHSPPSLSDSGRSGFGPIGLFRAARSRSHHGGMTEESRSVCDRIHVVRCLLGERLERGDHANGVDRVSEW